MNFLNIRKHIRRERGAEPEGAKVVGAVENVTFSAFYNFLKLWGPKKSNMWHFALVCNLLTPERARLRRFTGH